MNLAIVIQKFSVKALLEDCQGIFLTKQTPNLSFEMEIDDNLYPDFYSDPNWIKQIVINLLSNAFKYTPRGSVTLKAHNIQNGQITISVTDTGLGIKYENVQKLFKAFGKIENNENA